MIDTQNQVEGGPLTCAGSEGSHLLQLSSSPSVCWTYNHYMAGINYIILNSLACKSSVFLKYTAGSLMGVLLSSWIFSPLEERRMLEPKGPRSACLASLAVGYELMLFNHSLLEIINRLVLCTIKQMPQRLLQVTAPN